MSVYTFSKGRFGLSMLACFTIAPSITLADDLGTITVESTTIDDRFETKRNEASTVSVISGEKVDRLHTENLQQVLDAIPGITTEVQGNDSLKIHFRGIENQRFMGSKPGVAIVIDGVPVLERTGRVNIDLDNIESIKVIKGGASYLYGDDALAGAVVITTKRGAKQAGFKTDLEAGSFAFHKLLARAGFANDKFAGHVQASRRKSNGYWFESDFKVDSANGKFQYYLSDASDLTLGWDLTNRERDSLGTVNGITQAIHDPKSVNGRDFVRRFDVFLNKFFLTFNHDFGQSGNFMTNVYQFGDHTKFLSSPVRFDATGAPVTDPNAYTTFNNFRQYQRGVKSEMRMGGKHLAWMAGLDLRDNRFNNFSQFIVDHKSSPFSHTINRAGTKTGDDKSKERVYAGYGELKYNIFGPLTLTANGRFDRINLDFFDHLNQLTLERDFSVWSWRGGLTLDVGRHAAVYANISSGFRAPSTKQLFAKTISPFGLIENNPNLVPERAINKEIGLRGATDIFALGLDYNLALFQINRRNFIVDSAGQFNFSGPGRFENIGDMRSRGLELSLKSDHSRLFSADIAYTLLDTKYNRYDNFTLALGNVFFHPTLVQLNLTGNRIPRAPRHVLDITGRVHPMEGLTFAIEMNAQSSYFADEPNLIRFGGRSVFNLLANYAVKTSWGGISVFARGDNVLSRFYFNTARAFRDQNADFALNAEDASIIVSPGGRWTAGLTATF